MTEARLLDPPRAAPPAARLPDTGRLADWLRPRLPGLGQDPLRMTRIEGGQSNPSWVLRTPHRAWVLRARPGPAATLAPSAHAVDREFRVMQALRSTGVPVAPVRLLCEDESVLGASFYVMDFLDGRVLREPGLSALPQADRAAYHQEAARVLAALHAVDWQAAGLADFGRPGAFFSRLVSRWSRQYRASAAAIGAIEPMEQLAAWLPGHVPQAEEDPRHTTLTHGDYRIENLMFAPDAPRVVAVLDWELSTLGHPLADLAYNCTAWHLPPGVLQGLGGLDTAALGLPSARDYVLHYCARAGRDAQSVLQDWPFHMACSLFRLGAILAGIGERVQSGTAANRQAAQFAAMAGPVAQLGWDIARGHAPALHP